MATHHGSPQHSHIHQVPPPPPGPDAHRADTPATQLSDHTLHPATTGQGPDPVLEPDHRSQHTPGRPPRTWWESTLWPGPFAPSTQPRQEPGVPLTAVMDGAFELLGTLLDTQRRHVDQVLAGQRLLVGQYLAALAAAASPR